MAAGPGGLIPAAFSTCFGKNRWARAFYARHGFAWDGASVEVDLTPDTILTGLRYTRLV